jgi:co-chaperonin GroES (HSP10)
MSRYAISRTKITKEGFRPIQRHIIVTDMEFDERVTNTGIIIPNDDMKSSGIRPRWAQVYAIGPEFKSDELKVGNWICIAHGRWTRGIEVEDEEGPKTLRRVDENDILLISDEPVDDLTMGDKV